MILIYDKLYYDNIKYDAYNDAYTLEIKYEDENNCQTIWMELGCVWSREMSEFSDHIFWNIALSIYDKRKDIYNNMDKKLSTGQDLIRNFIITRKMFDALEARLVRDAVYHKRDIVIYCHWEDKRRRDAYYKVLSKKGYRYGKTHWGQKVIMKKFKWKDYKEIVENEEF